MDFRERLQRAAQRGQSARAARELDAAAQALSEEECKRRHSALRRAVSDCIEERLGDLVRGFPGFRLETIVDERGWGASVSRDDFRASGGKRDSYLSRLQILVGPYSKYHVLDVTAKGTIHNKESFTRQHYESLADADAARFRELIESWVLDYAESFAAA